MNEFVHMRVTVLHDQSSVSIVHFMFRHDLIKTFNVQNCLSKTSDQGCARFEHGVGPEA